MSAAEQAYEDRRREVLTENQIKAEIARLEFRHRVDFAKLYFEEDNDKKLRTFKRIYKIEMKENPERYTKIPKKDSNE